MDMHSNIRELHEHRDNAKVSVREHRPGREGHAPATMTVVSAEYGTGWYHDAAIEDARRAAIETRSHPVHW